MKCYICKKQTDRAIRHFLNARNKREKDAFRDVCPTCYPHVMEQEGYTLVNGIWTPIKIAALDAARGEK